MIRAINSRKSERDDSRCACLADELIDYESMLRLSEQKAAGEKGFAPYNVTHNNEHILTVWSEIECQIHILAASCLRRVANKIGIYLVG